MRITGAILLLLTSLATGCAVDTTGDDAAFSSTTNLYWQRCAVGAEWTGAECVGEPAELDWAASAEACAAFGPEYRLPTLEEVAGLLGDCTSGTDVARCAACVDSLECSSVLADPRYGWTWTADPSGEGAYVVDLADGRIAYDEGAQRFLARCVYEAP